MYLIVRKCKKDRSRARIYTRKRRCINAASRASIHPEESLLPLSAILCIASVGRLNSRYLPAGVRLQDKNRCESETKIYSNPTQRHRGTLKDSGATLSASQIRIIMSACLLRSVIRDFISSDKRIKEREVDIPWPSREDVCEEKSRLEFMMADLLSPRRFRSS